MPKTWLRSPRSPNWDDPANRAAIWNGEQVRLALPLSHIGPLSLGGLLLAAASQPSLAGCSSSSFFDPPFFPNNLLSNSTVTCFGVTTTRVGQGPGAENITLIVRDGATIGVTNTNAISLGGNVIINLGTSVPPGGSASNPPVLIQTTTNGGANGGQYGTGDNTIEFNDNSTLIINKNVTVKATGTQTSSEAINPFGSGNHIINYGFIDGGPSSAIFFENVGTTAASPRNSVDNFGTINAPPGPNPSTSGQAIGSFNNVGIDITNSPAARSTAISTFKGGTIP